MSTKLDFILKEIFELNSLDGKILSERFMKFDKECGKMTAEACKLVGITHKPFEEDHMREEMAYALQNSIYRHL